MHYFQLHFAEGIRGIVVQIDSGKPHGVGVPQDVDECDSTRPPLRRVHPVAAPRIRTNIPVSAIPDVEPVERVKQNRQPDPEQFKKEHQRQVRQKADLACVSIRPSDGRRVRNQNMFKQEGADRDDPREGMQPAQRKRNIPDQRATEPLHARPSWLPREQ